MKRQPSPTKMSQKAQRSKDPPRPPRPKAPKRKNLQLTDEPVTGDASPQEELERGQFHVDVVARMLEAVLPPPWKVIWSFNQLQVVKLPNSELNESGCHLTISFPAKLEIHVNDQLLGEDHSFWESCPQREVFDGQLGTCYIFGVIDTFINSDLTIAPVTPDVPEETSEKTTSSQGEKTPDVEPQTVPVADPKPVLLKTNGEEVTLEEILALMTENSAQVEVAIISREVEFVELNWSYLMKLFAARINCDPKSETDIEKMKGLYERTLEILVEWKPIFYNHNDLLNMIRFEEIATARNPYCEKDDYTLRSELSSNVRKIRTLRLYIRACCPSFWSAVSTTSPELSSVFTSSLY